MSKRPTVRRTTAGAPVYVERMCACGDSNDASDTLCGSCGADLTSAPTTFTVDHARFIADLAASFRRGGD